MAAPLSYQEILDPRRLAELRRLELRSKRIVDSDLVGRFRSSFRGSGLTFSELRQYQPGDEVKQIHWRASARTGTTYVKSYEEERALRILLAIDLSASTGAGGEHNNHRRAVEFAALITALSKSTGDAVGLLMFSGEIQQYIRCGTRRNQYHQIILSLLNSSPTTPTTDLNRPLEHIRLHERQRTVVFLLSDFFAPPFEDELKLTAVRHDVICVKLSTPSLSNEVAPIGLVQLKDAESGASVLLDLSSRRLRKFLTTTDRNAAEELVSVCRRSGADLIALNDNPVEPLLKLMQQRAKRLR